MKYSPSQLKRIEQKIQALIDEVDKDECANTNDYPEIYVSKASAALYKARNNITEAIRERAYGEVKAR